MALTCEDLLTYLSDYIDDNLSDELVAAAQEHIATCDNCRVVLSSTQQMILLYRERGQAQHIPKTRSEALYDQLAAAFAARQSEVE
ncbi:MAG: zf-HC2 domain-containing protein [Chloroflexota bacterium]